MSDFLGRIGRITEWVVVSNLENRAVNAACDKAQDLWKNRQQKKHDKRATPASSFPSTASAILPAAPFDQYGQGNQAASYMPPAPPAIVGNGQLLITVNHVDGLNQWGPLVVILECNHQRHHISLSQSHQQQQQQLSFPVYRFDSDQFFVWIQVAHQSQTIAHAEIPVQVLLNGNAGWAPVQQRWIPLRDHQNGPAGQVLVNVQYHMACAPMPHVSGGAPAPPPYSYYS
jgi:hypothetical protein